MRRGRRSCGRGCDGRAAVGAVACAVTPGRRPFARGCDGQAAVEVVALLPLVAAVALAVLQALAAGRAEELAGHAATSGAVALAEGRDGAAAARAAIPGDAGERLQVEVHGSRVHVRLAPVALIPGVAALLTASADADAGVTP